MQTAPAAPSVLIFPDRERLMRALADHIVRVAGTAIARRALFNVALAGGGTPRGLYRLLASEPWSRRMDWRRCHVFFGDERCVGPADPASNYRMARESLLDRVPLPARNIHRLRGEDPPPRAAAAYEDELRAHFGRRGRPAFDLVLLGLGADGHTASLFPGSRALRERERWVTAEHVEKLGDWRLSLTLPVLNAAHEVAFLAAGAAKSEPLAALMAGGSSADALPAHAVRPEHGILQFWVDADAAAQMNVNGMGRNA